MKKHLNLLVTLLKQNLVREIEYRVNFIIHFLIATSWIISQILIVEIIFQFTDQIVGWTKLEIFLLIGLLRIYKGVFDTFFYRNLFSLPEFISRGELDYSLTRPVDSQFLISLRKFAFNHVAQILTGLLISAYALRELNINFSLSLVLTFLFVIACGIVAYYSLFLLISTLAIFTTRLTALSGIHEFASDLMRYPADFFHRRNLLLEVLIFPIALIVTIPVRILLEKGDSLILTLQLSLAFLILLLSRRFWFFALRHYSSASS